jgi:hypothetical protein
VYWLLAFLEPGLFNLRYAFVVGIWCRFPRNGNVGGPGGRNDGLRVVKAYLNIPSASKRTMSKPVVVIVGVTILA